MVLCARLYLPALEDLVRRGSVDPSTFQHEGQEVSLRHLAAAAQEVLQSGRPDPAFPDWRRMTPDSPLQSRSHPADDAASFEYLAARQWLFQVAPRDLGFTRRNSPEPFGVVMETGYPLGTHTLAALHAGGVYNHLSNGLLDSTRARHPSVALAGEDFLSVAQAAWELADPTRTYPRPAEGVVRFYLLGPWTVREAHAAESALSDPKHPLADLYASAHGMLSAIHIIELEEQES